MTLLATHFPQALATLPVSLRLTCTLRNEQWKPTQSRRLVPQGLIRPVPLAILAWRYSKQFL